MPQMDTMIPARLCETTVVTSTTMTLVANTTGYYSLANVMWLHNPHTSAIAVTLYNVPDSSGSVGTATAAHQMMSESLYAGQTLVVEAKTPGIILANTNDTIQAKADITGYVTVAIHGFTLEV